MNSFVYRTHVKRFCLPSPGDSRTENLTPKWIPCQGKTPNPRSWTRGAGTDTDTECYGARAVKTKANFAQVTVDVFAEVLQWKYGAKGKGKGKKGAAGAKAIYMSMLVDAFESTVIAL
eukprot:2586818-Amphidinium_carterae.2